MWLIVGLGNPGKRFEGTRHNVGFWVVDEFAHSVGVPFKLKICDAVVGEGELEGERILVAKPQTFMNLSGKAVGGLVWYYHVPVERLLVIFDDADLPPGKIRVRQRGSSGGHKGMESIIAALGTENFPRIRIGIGKPDFGELREYVLSKFTSQDLELVRPAVGRAVEAIKFILCHGVERAMSEFNG